LNGSNLYNCTKYFSIVNKEIGSRIVDVSILPNHVNYLCMCVIGVYSRVFSFQTCLLHKEPIRIYMDSSKDMYICSNKRDIWIH
jgi:hypothetical protein